MPLLSTLTHARLRAAQGDLAAARRILRELLEADPDLAEARELLAVWEGRAAAPRPSESEEALPPTAPAEPRALAARFRDALGAGRDAPRRRKIARLESWLARLDRP